MSQTYAKKLSLIGQFHCVTGLELWYNIPFTSAANKDQSMVNYCNIHRKTSVWSLFLIKLQALQPATLFQSCPKRDFNIGDSCDKCEIFMNSLFYGTLPVAAFVSLIE